MLSQAFPKHGSSGLFQSQATALYSSSPVGSNGDKQKPQPSPRCSSKCPFSTTTALHSLVRTGCPVAEMPKAGSVHMESINQKTSFVPNLILVLVLIFKSCCFFFFHSPLISLMTNWRGWNIDRQSFILGSSCKINNQHVASNLSFH